MAFGGFSQEGRSAPMSEINMVPLIDVMLVLLIVFMITAPLLTHAVKIDLPSASSQSNHETAQTVALAVDEHGAMFWNDERIEEHELRDHLAAAAASVPQPELHLRADRGTRYEVLAAIMSAARLAGLHKMGFITQPD